MSKQEEKPFVCIRLATGQSTMDATLREGSPVAQVSLKKAEQAVDLEWSSGYA